MYNGVINVYKERGFTSFDVVAKLRGILKQKKIGHTGTLDPEAEGVLVVCLGKATKLCDILTDKAKSYETTMMLGRTTDTEDNTGKVLSEGKVTVSEQQIKEAILSYVGKYAQIPPMYSAIKVNGRKLYELAREGIEIEREPRQVEIYEIKILSMELPYVTFQVSCSKGTYIRSLCRDIGEKLGCGAVMDSLIRDSVNAAETGKVFTKEEALTIEKIEELVKTNQFKEHVLPIDSMFPNMAKVTVTEEGNKKLYNGNLLKLQDFEEKAGTECLVYDKEGHFTAIYKYHADLHAWKAEKMFL